jgi:AmmeMemoRadiSam system protein A
MKTGTNRREAPPSAISSQSPPSEAPALAATRKRFLLRAARQAINCHLNEMEIPAIDSEDPFYGRKVGVFVTLRTIRSAEQEGKPAYGGHPDGQLRGCVGRIQADLQIAEAVQQMAVRAAVNDPRFPPMRLDELAATRIEISLLSPLTRVTELKDIEIGRHGLVVEGGDRRGVLLPKVAIVRGWDQEQFVASTCRKAGLAEDAWPAKATLYAFEVLDFAEGQIE